MEMRPLAWITRVFQVPISRILRNSLSILSVADTNPLVQR